MSSNGHLLKDGYATREVVKTPPWHGLVAWDMLFNGLTTGLFLVVALGELVAPAVHAPLAKFAYPIALVFLTIDLILLVVDLGDPWRFHHMLRIFKPTSPMSLGVWSLTAYSLPLTLAILFGLLGDPFEWPRKAMLVFGLVPALASTVYKGVLLSTSAQPGWKDARWLGGYLACGAFALGCASALGLAIVMGETAATASLRLGLGAVLVLHAIVSLLLTAELRPTTDRIFTPNKGRLLMLLLAAGGWLLPLVLTVVFAQPLALSIAGILVIASSAAFRFVLMALPHASA
jgi:hypothetical protein